MSQHSSPRGSPTEEQHAVQPVPLPFPLKNCSCGVFRHLAKTGGSTIQSIFKRGEQLGDFYYAAFGTWNEIRPTEFNLLMREVRADFDGFVRRHPRMLMSFHKQTAEQFAPSGVKNHLKRRDPAFRIWEDLLELRARYRSRGCGFVLATMLRRPNPGLYVSDYLFEGAPSGMPLDEWIGTDIQTAALLGWPFGWNARRNLTVEHRRQAVEMLDAFDLVGLTERFSESLLLLARAIGLPHVQYRHMNAGIMPRQKQALLESAAARRAIDGSSWFDTMVYERYAARFGRGLALVDAPFRAALRGFEARVVMRGTHRYVGGLPPLDKYMVTSNWTCPRPTGGPGRVDYGGCPEIQYGVPGGPQTLADTKTLVPCDEIECTKIAADGFACSRWELSVPEDPAEEHASFADVTVALSASPRRAAQGRVALPVRLKMCKTIFSPPDGFM